MLIVPISLSISTIDIVVSYWYTVYTVFQSDWALVNSLLLVKVLEIVAVDFVRGSRCTDRWKQGCNY